MNALDPFDIPLDGIQLVEASAGTGKTYSITSLYIRALLDTPLTVEDILVVTYTEAATKELRDRLLRRIREAMNALESGSAGDDPFLGDLLKHAEDPAGGAKKMKRALHNFDRSAVHTIHGFCNQVLQEQAFESGTDFDTELVKDDSDLVREAADDYWREWVREVSEQPWKRPLMQYYRSRNIGPELLADELGAHIGKPYLRLRPTQAPEPGKQRLLRLAGIYEELREIWSEERAEIRERLLSGKLKYYQERYLRGWMAEMDRWLSSPAPPIDRFDKWSRFTRSHIRQSLKKGAEGPPPRHPFFEKADEYTRLADRLSRSDAWFRKRALEFLRKRVPARKERRQVYSYDDMLLKVRDALVRGGEGGDLAGALARRYPLALVDEFQDTDPVQYEIFEAIYGQAGEEGPGMGLFMIGDPKQSIYSFRGADIFTYLRAKSGVPADRTYSLSRNFRSVPRLIEAVNAFFGRHENPFILENIAFTQVTPGREEYRHYREGDQQPPPCQFRLPAPAGEEINKTEADRLAVRDSAGEIARILGNGEASIGGESVEAGDIAVLVFKHQQAGMMAEALAEWGINSVEISKKSVFSTQEAADLRQVLRAVSNPGSESLVRAALSTPLFQYSGNDLMDLREEEERWVSILEDFSRWNRQWSATGFGYMFRSLLLEARIAEHLMEGPEGERKVTNVLHLGELLQKQEEDGKGGPRKLLKYLERKSGEESTEAEEEQLRLESDENLVKIITMHRSKGLEFPLVFCPFLWRARRLAAGGDPFVYHEGEGTGAEACLDLGGPGDPQRERKRFLQAREELAEQVRLAYVAMTRARNRCCMTWIPARGSDRSALGYLLGDPDQSMELLAKKTGVREDARSAKVTPEARLDELAASHPELIACRRGDGEEAGPRRREKRTETVRPARSYEGSAPLPAFRITSFSSLTGAWHGEEDLPGLERTGGESHSYGEVPEGEESVFTFPRGPRPGTCLHNIFEKLLGQGAARPAERLEETVAGELRAFGISPRWESHACRMVRSALEKELSPGEREGPPLVLGQLDGGNRLPEMEFHFRTGPAEGRRLLGRIREETEGLPPLEDVPRGFLKGYIDLTLRHGDRYYLLDYKSNHLGDSSEDYRPERLREEVLTANYDLQYHLYTVALHRYLSRRLPGYDYETHFGGVWYLFLRGINPEGDEGLFFDRPPAGRVQSLDRTLRGEGA